MFGNSFYARGLGLIFLVALMSALIVSPVSAADNTGALVYSGEIAAPFIQMLSLNLGTPLTNNMLDAGMDNLLISTTMSYACKNVAGTGCKLTVKDAMEDGKQSCFAGYLGAKPVSGGNWLTNNPAASGYPCPINSPYWSLLENFRVMAGTDIQYATPIDSLLTSLPETDEGTIEIQVRQFVQSGETLPVGGKLSGTVILTLSAI
jgi:hypothetical protein